MNLYFSEEIMQESRDCHQSNQIIPQKDRIELFLWIRSSSENLITPQMLWESPDFNPLFCFGLQEIYFWPGYFDSNVLLEYNLHRSALESKGHFTRLLKYLQKFNWNVQIYEICRIQYLFHERALFSGDWHYVNFLNISVQRQESDHPIRLLSLSANKAPIMGRFTYPWQFWQTIQYIFEYFIWIPYFNSDQELQIQILLNELELGFAYYIKNGQGSDSILVLCRSDRNVRKLVEALRIKMQILGIPLYFQSILNFDELYSDHELHKFLQKSREYIVSNRFNSFQLPIFSTKKTMMFSPQDQLVIGDFLTDYVGEISVNLLVKINRIATELKTNHQLNAEQLNTNYYANFENNDI